MNGRERNAGGSNAWGQVAKLTASDAAAQNVFGYSASVAGDVVLVGSELADPGGVSDAGAAYLFEGQAREPMEYTPEMSRRARGVEIWAALRTLGRSGLAEMVERLLKPAN